ncbi:glycosyltransferase family 4 protein [Polyangium jinanense]|uniref:Glycosyltransferase family 4 protein n=1 Tax=Polyangium jinanense TaxID=2829994 RepID=A0A9X4AWV7_9BACT|nr:glycosyltransferase family 4 protein [Polyangium jinanense]MDC3957714.1 glycosyltransferase family 4 protein [Polyangium jinanense]MDC3987773.1 glycosyltransferase family 4 protein [Polyangium jinanense]
MKVAIARGAHEYGGIYRRFRELCAYCNGRHELLGLLLLGESDAPVATPVRTLSYAASHVEMSTLMHARSIDEVLGACEGIIKRVVADLERERPDKVMATDTDLKGLCVIAACRRLGLKATAFVAGLSSLESAYGGHRVLSAVMTLVERYCLEKADALIFPSRRTAELCAGRYPEMAPYHVIYNGIAEPFLHHPGPAPEGRRIGAVMRLYAIKNPEMLGKIVGPLDERGFSLELVADVKGKQRALHALGATKIREPMLDTPSLANFYAGCHAVVVPSRFEVSGNVPMEAIAVGTPAVITEEVGIAEIYHTVGLSHLIVPVDDVAATVERLVHAEPVPPAAREHLRKNCSWTAACERILDVL